MVAGQCKHVRIIKRILLLVGFVFQECWAHEKHVVKVLFEILLQHFQKVVGLFAGSHADDANFFFVDSRTPPRWSDSSFSCAQKHTVQRLPKCAGFMCAESARKVRGYYYSQNMAEKENILPISGVLDLDRPNSSKDRPKSSRITVYHAFYKSVAVGI